MATVSGGTTSERFGFVQRYGRELGVRYLCNWLGVSRSGYYDWIKREPSSRAKSDIELSKKVFAIHSQSRSIYGSPRVHRSLKQAGIHVGEKRVARLMRENSLKGRVVTVTRRAPKLRVFQQAGENIRLKAPPPSVD